MNAPNAEVLAHHSKKRNFVKQRTDSPFVEECVNEFRVLAFDKANVLWSKSPSKKQTAGRNKLDCCTSDLAAISTARQV